MEGCCEPRTATTIVEVEQQYGPIVQPTSTPLRMPLHGDTLTVVDSVTEMSVTVSIAERGPGGPLYLVYYKGKAKKKRSLRSRDREYARTEARTAALELARATVTRKLKGPAEAAAIVQAEGLTVGSLFDEFKKRASGLRKRTHGQQTHYLRTMLLTEAIWGRDLVVSHIDEDHAVLWVEAMSEGGIVLSKPNGGQEEFAGVEPRTIWNYWRALNTIFNWAPRQKVPGTSTRLTQGNPLAFMDRPFEVVEEDQPIADEDRFQMMLAYLQRRSSGEPLLWRRLILAAALAVARYTGRRRGAIAALRNCDVLLTPEQVEAELVRNGRLKTWAKAWPHGAIVWRWQNDKKKRGVIVPIPPELHALLAWLFRAKAEAGLPIVGEGPLLPAEPSSTQHVHRDTLGHWLRDAETELKAELLLADRPPLPDLGRWLWHAYRRLWRTERAAQGFHDKLTGLCGGWAFASPHAMNHGYLQFPDPRDWYACMANDPELLGSRRDAREGRPRSVAALLEQLSPEERDQMLHALLATADGR